MTLIVKNKDTLVFDDFKFKCCVGLNGFSNNKQEGDKKPLKVNLLWDIFILEMTEKKSQRQI